MTKTATPIETDVEYGDLKAVYLHTYAAFGTDPTDLADAVNGMNAKYARRLLSILVDGGLVVQSDSNGEEVWQTFKTYDDMDEDEAVAAFNDKYGTGPEDKPAKAAKPAATATQKAKHDTFHACYCGCGLNVPAKSFYKPGHDARHAGALGKALGAIPEPSAEDTKRILADLPSDRLIEKAKGIAAKARARAAKKAKPTNNTEDGTVKVGKNEYAATRDTKTGEVVYYDGDAVKAASKTAAKTFEAN